MADEFMETVVLFVLGAVLFVGLWPCWFFYTGKHRIFDTVVLYANLLYLLILASLTIAYIFFR